MNTSTLQFSPRRFGAVLRRDLRMELTTWLWRILAMVAVMALLGLAMQWFVYHIGDNNNDGTGHAEITSIVLSYFCWMYTSIFTSLGASRFMQGYATPGQRLSQLMVPASTLEKYASRFLISIIGVTVLIVGGWYVAEFVRVGVGHYVTDRAICPVQGWYESLTIMLQFESQLPLGVMALSVVCWQSFYMLGSAVWLKNAFLETLGAACLLEFIFGFVAGYMASLLKDLDTFYVPDFSGSFLRALVTVYLVGCTLFAYVTTYFRMREEEVIQRM